MAENQTKQSQKDRLKEITDSIETGIKDLFESDKYRTYLQTMSKFHKYSFNNKILIAMQAPNATLVAGFSKWKDGFGRNVKKGEKAIKIIAPVPYKLKEERTKLDPVTKAPLLDKDGGVQIEEFERQIPTFRVVSVFDYAQTEGKEIPTLVNDLVGNVENYELFMEALKRSSPVPIEIKPIANGADGFYHLDNKTITICEGMSEIQTICATIHEIAHSKLHDRAILDDNGEPIKKNRNTEEVEAESISYAVCNYYNIETADNSFGYIANWSKGKELKELKSSLELISKTSSELITDIDMHLIELTKERCTDLSRIEEKSFLESASDSFAIFQVKSGANYRDYHFASVKELEHRGKGIDRENYNLIYVNELQNVANVTTALDKLYLDFNHDKPDGFIGHSLSLSDIIAIKLNGVISCHYVDSFGFKEVDNYLKTAELSMEQNLNQIDGVINNEPTVAQLEQDINDGKAISILELANAVNSDKNKKKSVLAELKFTPPTKYKDNLINKKEMER